MKVTIISVAAAVLLLTPISSVSAGIHTDGMSKCGRRKMERLQKGSRRLRTGQSNDDALQMRRGRKGSRLQVLQPLPERRHRHGGIPLAQ